MQEYSPRRNYSFQLYRWLNILFVILLPAYAVLNGFTTVFYILYLYWWHELISSSLDGLYFHRNQKRNPGAATTGNPVWGRLFMLGIYLVFIIVFFGFVSNWGNNQLIVMNIRVLMLKDVFFVVNVTCLLINEWWLRYHYATKFNDTQNPFAGRMIVLHVSIIGGAVMYFWLTKEFPKTFVPGNLWGSVIIATPFLLAKAILTWEYRPS